MGSKSYWIYELDIGQFVFEKQNNLDIVNSMNSGARLPGLNPCSPAYLL